MNGANLLKPLKAEDVFKFEVWLSMLNSMRLTASSVEVWWYILGNVMGAMGLSLASTEDPDQDEYVLHLVRKLMHPEDRVMVQLATTTEKLRDELGRKLVCQARLQSGAELRWLVTACLGDFPDGRDYVYRLQSSLEILKDGGLELPDEHVRDFVLSAVERTMPQLRRDIESVLCKLDLAALLSFLQSLSGSYYGYSSTRTAIPPMNAGTRLQSGDLRSANAKLHNIPSKQCIRCWEMGHRSNRCPAPEPRPRP